MFCENTDEWYLEKRWTSKFLARFSGNILMNKNYQKVETVNMITPFT